MRVQSEEHLVTELGSPKILPVVIDIQKPETIEAVFSKVRPEGGRDGGKERVYVLFGQ